MFDSLYIKKELLKRDLERGWYNLTHTRPVAVNAERRKLIKLAGVGLVGLTIASLGADKLLEQKEDKKLVFRDKKGREILEIG